MWRFCAGLPLPLLLHAQSGWLSHSWPTYSLNSRLPTVPLIPCTRACATVTVHQPSKRPGATVTLPPPLQVPPFSTFGHFSDLLICVWTRKPRYQSRHSDLSPSIFPQQHPVPSSSPPPQPFSSFNLLLTTWRGIASSGPPLLSPNCLT